ncbi:MAG TPA: xanthine dehydrogenase family protein subunit M [Desulfosporosinus sp.]|nr:xanthine dehydrogenase family protein subunit M [Desulfosporosinus sp.]
MSFRTFSPNSEIEALRLLNNPIEGTLPIAGGTNVLVDIFKGKLTPRAIIDLSRIQEWKQINLVEGVLEIGSLVTIAELETSPLLSGPFMALAMAASLVGSPQIRNRGTLGGNLQSASPAADCVPSLLAFDAILTLVSASGKREVGVEDFFLGVGRTVLRPNELISKISLKLNPEQRSTFLKVGLRRALAISLVNLAVCLEWDKDQRCRKVRVAFGSVAPTPIRAKGIEVYLEGRRLDFQTIMDLAEIMESEISPITDIRASATYRRYLAAVLLQEALFNLTKSKEEHTFA